VLPTDDRQTTDGRATAYSEREREFTFAKNCMSQEVSYDMNIPQNVDNIYCDLSFFNARSCLAASHAISSFTFAIVASFCASRCLLISESISNSWEVNKTTVLAGEIANDE